MSPQPQRFVMTRAMPRLIALSMVGATALAACASSSSGGTPTTPSGSATTASSGSHVANVTITAADGCSIDATAFPAGALTIKVSNQDATGISEVELESGGRIVGEKENLPPGFSGDFVVSVTAGTYALYCPGAPRENTPITVTGSAADTTDATTAGLLSTGTKNYAEYVETQVGYLAKSVKKLNRALHGRSVSAAQAAYDEARPFYEKIEPVAESFTAGKTNLDANIDARAGGVTVSQWSGFHPIEKGLFQATSLAGLGSLGDGLVTNVLKLQKLTKGLTYKPFELANGAGELLDEVASSKITGEEERYSHIDLLDFAGNDEGAEQAFADLQPALTKIDASLTKAISQRFRSLDSLVDHYRTGSNPSGFVYYSALTKADKRKLAAAVKSVQEPLSQVASKVAHA